MSDKGRLCIVSRPRLAELTSIGLGGPAVALFRASDREGVEEAAVRLAELGAPVALLGRGSNILAEDGDLPLALLRLESDERPRVLREEQGGEEQGGRVLLEAHGGLKLSSLLAKAASLGLAGLEGLAGIPGSVGGAVAMNAGSFGAVMGSFVREVEVFSPLTGFKKLTAEDLEFSYRACRFPGLAGAAGNWLLVISVVLALEKGDPGHIRAAMRAVLEKKRRSQPIEARSAGSAFKNPSPEAAAGYLLERAGLKGRAVGGMCFSEKHANFLVNRGNGSCAQALELLALAKERVKAQSGHELELEVKLWP